MKTHIDNWFQSWPELYVHVPPIRSIHYPYVGPGWTCQFLKMKKSPQLNKCNIYFFYKKNETKHFTCYWTPAGGYYRCQPTGVLCWGLKNRQWDVGLTFWLFLQKIAKNVTLNETEIPKFSQFFPTIFPKRHPTSWRGTDLSNLVFSRPYLGLIEVKKVTLTSGAHPVPFFAQVSPPPGYWTLTGYEPDICRLLEKS